MRFNRAIKSTSVAAAVAIGSSAAFATERIQVNFVYDKTRIGYAQLVFDGDADGTLTLFERWCYSDSRLCSAGNVAVPAGFKRFFEREIKEPVSIELDGVTIRLNKVVGLDARLIASTVSRGEVFRDFQILQGENRRIEQQTQNRPASTVSLTAADGNGDQMLVFTADNGNAAGSTARDFGTVVQLPASLCGQIRETCGSFTFEPPDGAFALWLKGETSENEPQLVFHEDLEINLFRNGNDLAAEVVQYGDNDSQKRMRFEGKTLNANSEEAIQALDCSQREITVGGIAYHIFRQTDNVCIGTVSWAVIPDPIANISLADDWCGTGQCSALELRSDSFVDEQFPTRFWEGQTHRPSLVLQTSDEGWAAPVGLFASEGRLFVRIVSATRADGEGPGVEPTQPRNAEGETYKIADIPGPLGIYAVVQERTDLDSIGNIGDNLCLLSPVIYSGGGRIWFKELGAPINGNPYRITSWMECSRFDGGPENCVTHKGTPAAPNPVASQSGFEYTPIGDGHFKICSTDEKGECGLLYACVGGDRPLTFDSEFPAGGNMVEAMLATYDRKSPGFRYIDNETILIEE